MVAEPALIWVKHWPGRARREWSSPQPAGSAVAISSQKAREAFHSILYVEAYALREWQLRPEIDSVGGATHVGFP